MWQTSAAIGARWAALQAQTVWRGSKEPLTWAAFMHISDHGICYFQE